jgi:hypothetical protein
MSFHDYVGLTRNQYYHGFIHEANFKRHCFIARVIWHVFDVEFYMRCAGQTPDEAPTAHSMESLPPF